MFEVFSVRQKQAENLKNRKITKLKIEKLWFGSLVLIALIIIPNVIYALKCKS